jgi:type II secretory pathway component PulF
MPVYACRVADGKGKTRELLREAASEESLLRELASRELHVLSLRERRGARARDPSRRRFSRKLVVELTDLLSLMMGSGLSLKDSLEVAQTVFDRGAGSDLSTMLLERIRKGNSFHAALEGAGESFPPVYRGLVRVGERIGTLDTVFAQLSAYLNGAKKLRERLGTALIYPAIVLGVAIASMVLMAVLVLPMAQDLFAGLGGEAAAKLSELTASLVGSAAIGLAVAAAIGAFVLFLAVDRRKGGRTSVAVDALLLRSPLVPLVASREMLAFSFAMETLTGAGVGVEEALNEASGATGNGALRAAIVEVRRGVLRGERLAHGFSRNPIFPGRFAHWVGVGEKVGRVDRVFGQLRLYYQQEVEKCIQRLTALIEPALIVFLGLLILLFVVSFVVPLFSLYGGAL